MRSNTHRFMRRLALAIAVSALAVPVTSVALAAANVYGSTSATPQTTQRSDASGVVLRRDGSRAVPFVADVGPEATATGDGFGWGDAGIGATATLALAAFAAGAGLLLGRRPSRSHTPRRAHLDPRRTRMKKLALLLSLLALGALGLVACDDSQTTAASETGTTPEELAADNKSCGAFLPDHDPPFRLAVVEGDISCRVARRVMHDWAYDRLPFSWSCSGPEANVLCTKRPGASSTRSGASSRIVITARFSSEAVTVEVDPGNNNQLSNEERIEQKPNEWAAVFAKAGPLRCRYMGQPACVRAGCARVSTGTIKNCTPVSYEFRKKFADATVERVVVEGHHAVAQFSNGESVEFEGPGDWFVTERWIKQITRRNSEP